MGADGGLVTISYTVQIGDDGDGTATNVAFLTPGLPTDDAPISRPDDCVAPGCASVTTEIQQRPVTPSPTPTPPAPGPDKPQPDKPTALPRTGGEADWSLIAGGLLLVMGAGAVVARRRLR